MAVRQKLGLSGCCWRQWAAGRAFAESRLLKSYSLILQENLQQNTENYVLNS